MTSTTHEGLGRVSASRRTGTALRRAVSRVVEAQQARAQRYVNGYLLTLDDATLATYGYDRRQLERQGSASYPL